MRSPIEAEFKRTARAGGQASATSPRLLRFDYSLAGSFDHCWSAPSAGHALTALTALLDIVLTFADEQRRRNSAFPEIQLSSVGLELPIVRHWSPSTLEAGFGFSR